MVSVTCEVLKDVVVAFDVLNVVTVERDVGYVVVNEVTYVVLNEVVVALDVG